MRTLRTLVALTSYALLWLACTGCAPRLRVIPHPDFDDPGIRYYRPKPYLFLSPAGGATASRPAPAAGPGEMVAIELRYLPDFGEEYALDVRTGWGSANVKIELQDGWNLVALNQDLDSKVDKNISAMAELVKAVPLGATRSESIDDEGESRVVIQASNIPLGFYEAVVGADGCGKKRLYGFRYVGFLPFANCPICPSGAESANCCDGSLNLYGLVFEKGVMVFRNIGQIGEQADPAARTVVQVARLPAP